MRARLLAGRGPDLAQCVQPGAPMTVAGSPDRDRDPLMSRSIRQGLGE